MDSLWVRVELIQGAVLGITVIFGCLFLKLRLHHALLSSALVLPAPIIRVTPGVAGFIYAGDVIAIGWVVLAFCDPKLRPRFDAQGRTILWTSGFLLLVWPFITTAAAILAVGNRDPKLLSLAFLRGVGYAGLFCAALSWAQRGLHLQRYLALQCFSFGLTCLFGLLQFTGGVDLDLWNRVAANTGESTMAFGGGFLGLYRGAVGAWAAALMTAGPFAFMRWKRGWLLTSMITPLLFFSTVATGSRQGTILGSIGFVLALCAVARTSGAWKGSGIVQVLLIVACVIGAVRYMSIQAEGSALIQWVEARYGSTTSGEQLVSSFQARQANVPDILFKVWSDRRQFILGAGHGSIVSEVGVAGGYDVAYIDSEVTWVLQQGGVVALFAYTALLLQLFRRLCCPRTASAYEKTATEAARTILLLGCLFSIGHFFLLHVQSSQAPVAYWYWAFFGAAVGVLPLHRTGTPLGAPRAVRQPVGNARDFRN